LCEHDGAISRLCPCSKGSRKGIIFPMLLTLLNVAGFFGLVMLAAIFISANRKATERKRRKKRAQSIKQRLQDEAIAS
jgi:hypothetical protein